MKRHWFTLCLLGIMTLSLTLVSCDDDDVNDNPNIVEFVKDNDDFSILADAITAAGLETALSDATAAFTVFAPTNAAFETFLADNNFNSLSDIPTATLQQVLTYHVIGSAVLSKDLETGYYGTAAEFEAGEPLVAYINTTAGVQINGAVDVTAADEEVANGVIHVVDAVIDPANVVTFATSDPIFSNLVAALTRTDLTTDFVATLSGEGPFTVFAPTNMAFENLLASNNEWNSLDDIPVETLDAVLKYHVIAGANVRAGDLTDGLTATTFQGSDIEIDLDTPQPSIIAGSNTANIIATDVQGTNGVVHAIDAVILP